MSLPKINLDVIRIPDPCPVPWDSMHGSARVRFCSQCKLDLFNLSELAREEAEALIVANEGKLCASYYQRTDGTVMSKDCREFRWQRARERLVVWGGVVLSVLILLPNLVLTYANRDRSEGEQRGLRDIEPFHTVFEWFDPTPKTFSFVGGVIKPPPYSPSFGPPADGVAPPCPNP